MKKIHQNPVPRSAPVPLKRKGALLASPRFGGGENKGEDVEPQPFENVKTREEDPNFQSLFVLDTRFDIQKDLKP